MMNNLNKKTLVLNCTSGISGDMTVAALLDLGADPHVLLHALDSFHLEGAKIVISRVKKSALDACDFNVVLDAEHENHDHDMAYLHPDRVQEHSHEHEHHHEEHSHEHEHHHDEHSYEHEHGHEHHHHHHGRNLADIEEILRSGDLTEHALAIALRIFRIVAEAESKVHGEPIEHVHFHEVGAVDSILDIAATAVCIDNLGITDVIVTDLTEGTGTVNCQHGLLPVPVPATTAILSSYHIPFHIASSVQGELITPTGAAIVAALKTSDRLPETFRIVKSGLGAGKRNYKVPGVVRAMLIEEESVRNTGTFDSDQVLLLQANIDDSTGEALGYTMECLMEHGALDAWYTPIYMKKHRPAYMLSVLCEASLRERMEDIIFRNTTTIGIRAFTADRTKLQRKIISIETPLGMADVKCCEIHGDRVVYPEADSVIRLAKESGKGYTQIYQYIKDYAEHHPEL